MKIRTLIVLLILLVVVGVGGYFIYQQQTNNARAATVAQRQTGTLTVGSLVATVSGAGNISAPQQTALGFQLSGVPITRINVAVGSQVKAGDLLAQEDDTDLQFAVRTAQAGLANAQASLAKLKQAPLPADVTAAQAAVNSSQTAYQVAVNKNAHASDQIMPSKVALDNATATLQQAQAAYNAIAWRTGANVSSQALALQTATNNYQAAVSAYNLALVDINDSAVKSAAQSLASAQSSLVKLTQPPSDLDLAIAQASVDSAQVSVDQAQRKLAQAQIVAPFDGTVAAVNYVVGQLSPSASTAVLSVVNMNNLQTQITVSEVDIARVKVGEQVILSFDALGGQSFPGKIVSISPVGTVTSGVVNYVTTVALTKPSSAIMPGMTAQAAITVAQRDNVLMAPNRAVKALGTRHVLTILFEGREVPVVVQTGLNNDTDTEIVSATDTSGASVQLQDGDVVVLNPTTTTGGNRGGPNILFGGGRVGGGD